MQVDRSEWAQALAEHHERRSLLSTPHSVIKACTLLIAATDLAAKKLLSHFARIARSAPLQATGMSEHFQDSSDHNSMAWRLLPPAAMLVALVLLAALLGLTVDTSASDEWRINICGTMGVL
jgi:hypothetical protein